MLIKTLHIKSTLCCSERVSFLKMSLFYPQSSSRRRKRQLRKKPTLFHFLTSALVYEGSKKKKNYRYLLLDWTKVKSTNREAINLTSRQSRSEVCGQELNSSEYAKHPSQFLVIIVRYFLCFQNKIILKMWICLLSGWEAHVPLLRSSNKININPDILDSFFLPGNL